MKKFIGRHKELKRIKERLEQPGLQFVTITGRRGVGKTALINHLINQEFNLEDFLLIKIEGVKTKNKKQQLINIFNLINRKLHFSNEEINYFNSCQNWFALFQILKDHCNQKNVFLVIDEFAWLDSKNSDFVEYFGNFVNNVILSNTKIIISASAISWMNKNVFNNKGGLYHRANLIVKLKPFTLIETLEWLKVNNFYIQNSYLLLKYYAITGGVVRYLEKMQPNLSFEDNAVEVFKNNFNVSGFEFEDLFFNTFNSNSGVHQKIMDAFEYKKSHTINSLVEYTHLSPATISNALNELVISDILFCTNFYKNKTKEAIYTISDLFCLSHLKLVKDKALENVIFKDQTFSINMGLIFETICKLNIDLIKKEIDHNLNTIEYAWHNDKAQIDLIIEYYKHFYSIVECKFYQEKRILTENQQLNLLNKRMEFLQFLNKKGIRNRNGIEINFIICSIYDMKPKDSMIGFSAQYVAFDDILKRYI